VSRARASSTWDLKNSSSSRTARRGCRDRDGEPDEAVADKGRRAGLSTSDSALRTAARITSLNDDDRERGVVRGTLVQPKAGLG